MRHGGLAGAHWRWTGAGTTQLAGTKFALVRSLGRPKHAAALAFLIQRLVRNLDRSHKAGDEQHALDASHAYLCMQGVHAWPFSLLLMAFKPHLSASYTMANVLEQQSCSTA